MLGNDVVDLRDPDALPELAPRFDARVFGRDELRALDVSPDRARQRWRLWAAKEAAYKAAVREDPGVVFSPVRFRVHLEPEAREGRVETPSGECLHVRVSERDGAVHAVARRPGELAFAGMTRLDRPGDQFGDQGTHARHFAIGEIARVLELEPDALEIRKRGRIPELRVRGRAAALRLSLSHHGDVVGFACEASP